MPLLPRLKSLVRNLAPAGERDRSLDEELRAYGDLVEAESQRLGLSPEQARRRAHVEMGSVESIKESVRDARIGSSLLTLGRELRYTLRSLGRARAFAVVAIGSLALGISGATAVFSVISAALLRPLPAVEAPDRLVEVEETRPTMTLAFSYPDYVDLRRGTTQLTGLVAHNGTSVTVTDSVGSGRFWMGYVSDNFFTTLGIPAVMGRVFRPGDVTVSGADPVVVLSWDFWQRRYGGTANVVGSTMRLNGYPFTVIGVAERGFVSAMRRYPMDFWVPLTMAGPVTHGLSAGILDTRNAGWLRLIGRLAPGATVESARGDLSANMRHLATVYPSNVGRGVSVSAGVGLLPDERAELERMPRLVGIAVGLLLLIASANVAGLSLVRATARRRELATRLALGAARSTLVRQLALEGVVVAGIAAALGVGLAFALVRSAAIMGTLMSVRGLAISVDGHSLAAALGVAGVSSVLVALVPAAQVSHLRLEGLIRDGSGGAVRRRSLSQRALVSVQVGASLVLLATAAVIFNAFHRLLDTPIGFEARGLTYTYLDLRSPGYDTVRSRTYLQSVLDRIGANPSYSGVALTTTMPPQEWGTRVSIFRYGEAPPPSVFAGHEFEMGTRAYTDAISPGLFGVMRIPIELGRAFTDRDDGRAPPVVIVSRRLANELWPGRNPVGERISWPSSNEGGMGPPLTVVGVAADTRHALLSEEAPFVMYVPLAQHRDFRSIYLLVRGRNGEAPSPAGLERLVSAIDPNVLPRESATLTSHVAGEVEPQQTASTWIGAFGIIALVLASIGVYGVVAQSVLQRKREMAVRAALGATPRAQLALVIGEGMRLTALGAATGLLSAFAVSRVLRTLFDGVRAVDSMAVAAAVALLVGAMLVASYIPARRALRFDPIETLRSD